MKQLESETNLDKPTTDEDAGYHSVRFYMPSPHRHFSIGFLYNAAILMVFTLVFGRVSASYGPSGLDNAVISAANQIQSGLQGISQDDFTNHQQAIKKLQAIVNAYPNPFPNELNYVKDKINFAMYIQADRASKYQAIVAAQWYMTDVLSAGQITLTIPQQISHLSRYVDYLFQNKDSISRNTAQNVIGWMIADPLGKQYLEQSSVVGELQADLHQLYDLQSSISNILNNLHDMWERTIEM